MAISRARRRDGLDKVGTIADATGRGSGVPPVGWCPRTCASEHVGADAVRVADVPFEHPWGYVGSKRMAVAVVSPAGSQPGGHGEPCEGERGPGARRRNDDRAQHPGRRPGPARPGMVNAVQP